MAKGHTQLSPLISASQNITSSWTDLGQIYDCFGFTVIGIFLKLTINDSQDFRIRLVGKTSENDSVEYSIPFKLDTIENSWVKYGDYVEIDIDIDKNMLLFFNIEGVLPCFKVQVQAGFVGSTAAQITSASYILGTK